MQCTYLIVDAQVVLCALSLRPRLVRVAVWVAVELARLDAGDPLGKAF